MKNNFCIIVLLFLSCNMPSHNNIDLTNLPANFDVQGHRGCRGLMPENTIPAFIKAIELGVTTLEMDAVITKDNKVVISHEPFFNHEISSKTNGSFVTEDEEKNFNIYTMTYSDVQQFDVGLKPHPRFTKQQKQKATKPLLSEVIDSAEAFTKRNNLPQIFYNIETKSKVATDTIFHPSPQQFVDLIMEVVIQKNITERTIIQSLDIRTLQYVHIKYPTVKTAYLFKPPSLQSFNKRLEILGFLPTFYSPSYQLVNEAIVKECHSKNIKIIPWTVNDTIAMKKLIAMGVDGLITDYPNLLGKKNQPK